MLGIAAFLCAGASLADGSDVTGAWDLAVKVPEGQNSKAEISFTVADGKLAGSPSTSQGSVALRNVRQEDRKTL
jgi:hypothetical protein